MPLAIRWNAFAQKGDGVIEVATQHGADELTIDLLSAARGRQERERQRSVEKPRRHECAEGVAGDMELHAGECRCNGCHDIIEAGSR